MQGQQRAHDFDAVATSVHKIPIENVLVCLAGQTRGLQNVQQVRQLACGCKKEGFKWGGNTAIEDLILVAK